MVKRDTILMLSFEFAVRVVNVYRYLADTQKEYVLSKQLLRSGTSIGANVQEAQAAQTKKDFIAKMSIASKEARETKYWIDLLIRTKYLDPSQTHVQSLLEEIESIVKLLTSIVKTAQKDTNAH
jgi:four helix bundle protein